MAISAHKVGCTDDPNARVLRVVHISDTHGCHGRLSIPDGDILVHSGDFFCWNRSLNFLKDTAELDRFFAKQPHKFKIFVAGNHETSFCGHSAREIQSRLPSVTYLQDASVVVEGLLIYGSPWTGHRHSPATAFTTPYKQLYSRHWSLIPRETKLLVTHSPPHGILDNRGTLGCARLTETVKQIRPLAHLFGHAHHVAQVFEEEGILFSNASQGKQARGRSKPIVIDVYLPSAEPCTAETVISQLHDTVISEDVRPSNLQQSMNDDQPQNTDICKQTTDVDRMSNGLSYRHIRSNAWCRIWLFIGRLSRRIWRIPVGGEIEKTKALNQGDLEGVPVKDV